MIFNTPYKKTIRDILSNKIRTILVILTMAIGLFSIGLMYNTQLNVSQAVKVNTEQANKADVTFYTAPFPDEKVEKVAEINGIAEVEGRLKAHLRVRKKDSLFHNLNLIAYRKPTQINRFSLGSTTIPKGKIAIESSAMKALDIENGDKLVVKLPDSSLHKLEVVDNVHDFNQVPFPYKGSVTGYISMETLTTVTDEPLYNVLHIKLDREKMQGKSELQASGEIEKGLNKLGIEVHRTTYSNPNLTQMKMVTDTLLMLFTFLGASALLFSGSMLLQTSSSFMVQEEKQIGVMKVLGAGKRRIFLIYGSYFIILSILSLAVGIPGAWFGSAWLSEVLTGKINAKLVHFSYFAEVIVLQISLSLMVPFLIVVPKLANVGGKSIALLLKRQGKARVRMGTSRMPMMLYRCSWMLSLSLKNTFRNKGRFLLTFFTLSFGGILLISVFILRASLLNTVDHITEYWNYDVEIDFHEAYPSEELEDAVSKIDNVHMVEGWVVRNAVYSTGQQSNSNSLLISLPENSAFLSPNPLKGSWLKEHKSGVVINTVVSAEAGLRVGDSITLNIGNKKKKVPIIGIAPSQLMGSVIYMKENDYNTFFNKEELVNRIVLMKKSQKSGNPISFQKKVEHVLQEKGYSVSSMDTKENMRERPKNMISILSSFLSVVAVLFIAVGIINLYGTMNINVIERTKELGILRAIGATTFKLNLLIIMESCFIGISSWCMSVLAAIPLSKLVSNQIGHSLIHAPLFYKMDYQGIWIWLLVIVILSFGASLLPIRRISKRTISQSLSVS